MKNTIVAGVRYGCDHPGCDKKEGLGAIPPQDAGHSMWREFAADLKKAGWKLSSIQGGECKCPEHNA